MNILFKKSLWLAAIAAINVIAINQQDCLLNQPKNEAARDYPDIRRQLNLHKDQANIFYLESKKIQLSDVYVTEKSALPENIR